MKTRLGLISGALILVTLIAVAYYRAGVLNLPPVPAGITAVDAGLDRLHDLRSFDESIRSDRALSPENTAIIEARGAVSEVRLGNEENGIRRLQALVRRDPTNLVLGNLLRVQVFTLIRHWLVVNANQGEIALKLPAYLEDQPARFFHDLLGQRGNREVKLQLALALVDHMLLFPALEIKAPASVEAVEILSGILDQSDIHAAYYVPALYARGLNYLYRPFNLVWPERIAAVPDAASKDIGLAIAVGQKIGAGSTGLKGELSLALGDAYAKEGKLNTARSWWQLANNLARDDRMRHRVFTRLQWNDEDLSANLEATLQKQMDDIDHPLSDLRIMWQ